MKDYEYHLVEEVRAGRMTRRDLVRRASIFGLSASAIATSLASCDTGGDSEMSSTTAPGGRPRRGGSVVVAQTGLSTAVDPVTAFSAGAVALIRASVETLAMVMPDYTIQPRLATKWTPVNSKEWRFTLRDGVRFQDGHLLTADDVVYTFDLILNPKSGSAASAGLGGILPYRGVEKIDDSTVAFHLDRPYVDFPYLVATGPNTGILPKGYQIGEFVKGRIGTGPFILTQYTPRQRGTFQRNPRYWNKSMPYLDSYQVRFYADYSSMVLALQSGDVDIVPGVPYTSAKGLLKNSAFRIVEQRGSAYREVHMRVDKAPWSDTRVRQALAYTVDREGAIAGLLGGNAQLANDHGFAPFVAGAPTAREVPQRKQDLARAKALLEDAGHSGGLTAELTAVRSVEIPSYVTLLKADAAKAGINIDLRIQDVNTYYGSGNNQPWLEVPFGCVDWAPRPVAGPTIDTAYTCGAVWNSAHWCDKRFGKLVSAYEEEQDEQRRHQYAVKAASIQHNATPALIAYWVTELVAVKAMVQGYNPIISQAPIDPRSIWLAAS